MNKRNKRFLSLFVSAVCAGYTFSSANIGYAEEIVNTNGEGNLIVSDEVTQAEDNNIEENIPIVDSIDNEFTTSDNEKEKIIDDQEDCTSENNNEERAYHNIINGTATLEDFKVLDVTVGESNTVDESNIEGISKVLKGKRRMLRDVQALKGKIYNILEGISIYKENYELNQFENILDFEFYFLNEEEKTFVFDSSEHKLFSIENPTGTDIIETLLEKISTAKTIRDKAVNGTATLEDYQSLDVRFGYWDNYLTVDESNVEGISKLLKGRTDIRDINQLIERVCEILGGIAHFKEDLDLQQFKYILKRELYFFYEDEKDAVFASAECRLREIENPTGNQIINILLDEIEKVNNQY